MATPLTVMLTLILMAAGNGGARPAAQSTPSEPTWVSSSCGRPESVYLRAANVPLSCLGGGGHDCQANLVVEVINCELRPAEIAQLHFRTNAPKAIDPGRRASSAWTASFDPGTFVIPALSERCFEQRIDGETDVTVSTQFHLKLPAEALSATVKARVYKHSSSPQSGTPAPCKWQPSKKITGSKADLDVER